VFLKKKVNELRANLEIERNMLCRESNLLKIEIDGLVKETKGLRWRKGRGRLGDTANFRSPESGGEHGSKQTLINPT
jgi:hypothetical protein